MPAIKYTSTEQKLDMFQVAYGTSVVKDMQEKYAIIADKFPIWAIHSDCMAQHITWTALEAEGFGANLQHYNPPIDAGVQKAWNIPVDWELNAQHVFGTPTSGAGDKKSVIWVQD
ncbi:hypothetical protein OIDMADRAFT_62502 [Oidiodendron maius Zn]|uniref:Uncharacterized protein n=1 Tax=Oidiodendron maius (strain Zn) TaxID=913774 RepID=A0A0C3GLS5_OIDMZ|nr:hypothetical protein OIDMADRAFT_62502 [Oidiodendron maius Zn]